VSEKAQALEDIRIIRGGPTPFPFRMTADHLEYHPRRVCSPVQPARNEVVGFQVFFSSTYTPPLPSLDVVILRLLLKLTMSSSSRNPFVLSSTPLFATLSDSHVGPLSHATSACSCSNPLQTGLRSHAPLGIHLDRRLFGASLSTTSSRSPSSLARALAVHFSENRAHRTHHRLRHPTLSFAILLPPQI
jgi:hypothetical protein